MLRAIHRVAKPGALMAFGVISLPETLTAPDRQRALNSGPTFVEADDPYPSLLAEAGWEVVEARNVSDEWATTAGLLLRETERVAGALRQLYGEPDFTELLEGRRATAAASAAGLLKREWLVAAKR